MKLKDIYTQISKEELVLLAKKTCKQLIIANIQLLAAGVITKEEATEEINKLDDIFAKI